MMIGQDFIVNGQGIFHDRSKIFMMAGWDFIMADWDFQDSNRLRYSWWKVKIFMMAGRDFVMNDCWDFHYDRSVFYYERLKFFWLQV